MIRFPFDLNIFPESRGAYIVGGSLRDLLLGRTPADYDIAVSADPEAYAAALSSGIKGKTARIGKSGFDTIRVISEIGVFDVSPIQGTSIRQDLSRRDFTVNAMAYDISVGHIIDPFAGSQDLGDRRVRVVTLGSFRNDPIRLLRAFRICAVLGFHVSRDTRGLIAAEASGIRGSAGERIREELFKFLATDKSHGYLGQMMDTGLLLEILPEMEAMRGHIGDEDHSHDLLDDTLEAYGHLEDIINDPLGVLPDPPPKDDPIHGKRASLLKCAMLLHGVGKPMARTTDHGGGIRFPGHADRSAGIADGIAVRLRFSNDERRSIGSIIRYHTRPLELLLAGEEERLTHETLTRFFITAGEHTPDILLHSVADGRGRGDPFRDRTFIGFVKGVLARYYQEYLPLLSLPPLVTGNDLMESLGMPPSPLLGSILGAVEEARLSGRIRSRNAAISLAEAILAGTAADP